jgi:hypothetical protein
MRPATADGKSIRRTGRSEAQAAVESVPPEGSAEVAFGLLEAVEPVEEPLVVEVVGGLVDS